MSAKRPNIVLILVDDMGYSDLGCYGGEISTPNIDALASRGLRFTQTYNTSRCCPSRATLLTGLYPHQAGVGWMTACAQGTDGYAGDLNNRCRTIAECLRPAGYSTYMSGKWHLTRDEFMAAGASQHSWPLQRGFDRYFGSLSGCGSYWTPNKLVRDNALIEPGPGYYHTDAISDNACGFIREHCQATPERPFFLYTAYTAPHWPLHAQEADIAAYRGKFMRGWDTLRREKLDRMREMGILDGNWELSPRDEKVPAWDSLTPAQQDEFDMRMAIYAAQLTSMDRGVGRIVKSLRDAGRLDDTVILFLSDNGGCHEEIHWKKCELADFGTDKSFESYGRPWANLSNTPFRMFKSWVHEGGISTPLVVHWPAGIGHEGRFERQVSHIVDILPTCLELAGATYPYGDNDNLHPLAGASLVPAFSGQAIDRDVLFWEHEGNRALRMGKWKLVAKSADGPWELYDIGADRSELHDLARLHKDLLDKMAARWTSMAQTMDVFPLDGRSDWNARCKDPLAVCNQWKASRCAVHSESEADPGTAI
jgi:arylsulfatase